jgi:ubiquinone/menaquinone biosynthesis C-methylase UbiE
MTMRWRNLLPVAVVMALSAGQILTGAAQLGSRSAEEWVKTLDAPTRIQNLKIDETIARLGLKAGMTVADIGAGSGVFEGPLATAVGPRGTVYAVDLDRGLLDAINKKAAEARVTNVKTVLGRFTDPALPASDVDVAFINDVLHHIEDRSAYLKSLARYIKPSGRIAVIDFHPDAGGHRNQPELQVSKDKAASLMAEAGFKPIEEIALFTDKYFVVYGRQ